TALRRRLGVRLRPSLPPFSSSGPGPNGDPRSFPTRRSSDLGGTPRQLTSGHWNVGARFDGLSARVGYDWTADGKTLVAHPGRKRSEEHTSELQSRGHIVWRLLLEKKNVLRLPGGIWMRAGGV